MKGLRVNIYKHRGRSGDGKANFSNRVDEVTLISSKDFNFPEIFEVTEDYPAVMIIQHPECPSIKIACPVKNGKPDIRIGGKTFIYSNNDRFPSGYPLPLYDRIEELED